MKTKILRQYRVALTDTGRIKDGKKELSDKAEQMQTVCAAEKQNTLRAFLQEGGRERKTALRKYNTIVRHDR